MTLHCLIYKDSFFTLDRNAVQTVWCIVQCSVTNVHGFLVFLLAEFWGKLHLLQVPFPLKSFVMASLTSSSVMPSGQTPGSYCTSRMSVSTSDMALAQVVSCTSVISSASVILVEIAISCFQRVVYFKISLKLFVILSELPW